MSFASCPVTGHHWQEPDSVFFTHSYIYSLIHLFTWIDKILLSLLFSRMNSPSSLSLSSYERYCSPFIILTALSWTCSSKSISVLYRGAHKWTQHSRCGLASADYRGGITVPAGNTPPNAAQDTAGLFFATGVHCWLMVSLLSRRNPRSFLAKLLSSQLLPACAAAWDYYSPYVGLCISPCCTLWDSSLPLLSKSLNSGTTIWCISHSFLFCIICERDEDALSHSCAH